MKLGSAGLDLTNPPFTLVFRNPSTVLAIAQGRNPLRFVEAYFRDDIDIEGDFFVALQLKDHLHAIYMSWRDRVGAMFAALRLRASIKAVPGCVTAPAPQSAFSVKSHSKAENRDAIAFHYDVSNAFYALWLDEAMVYSCAYFEQPDDDLDQAQRAKLNHICHKLLLKPGERLLDIGCGALIMYAAKNYGVHAHGVTLSQHQLELANQRIAQAGLQDLVTIELRDYRT
ncbi:class I SAM-dependent methyltransferase [Pseudomonas sp. PCH446]